MRILTHLAKDWTVCRWCVAQ